MTYHPYRIGQQDLQGDDVTDAAIRRAAEEAVGSKMDTFAISEDGTWAGHIEETFPHHLVRGHWYVDGPIIDILVNDP